MKLELTIEKNVVLKRDKPWSHFYSLNDHEVLCRNEQNKFEIANSSTGKIEHLSQKSIATVSKGSTAYCLSNNGQICAFLSSNYEITLWNKDKLIRTIPTCSLASKTIKTKSHIFVSNNGEQAILILEQPCRIFLWLKTPNPQIISSTRFRHKSPICSSVSNQSIIELGTWNEIKLSIEQLDSINFEQSQISIDVFFRSKNSSIICAFVYVDRTGSIQIHRLDIDWKSTLFTEQMLSYSFENIQIPLNLSSTTTCSIHFAHWSPILAISFLTNVTFVSLTALTFSKILPIDCTISSSSSQQVSINDFIWSFDDQFIIGLTNRGALFFVHRFGLQIQLQTKGECIAQGPASFVIIHPLIGQDSEATSHLGLDSFMRSILPFSNDDKTKQQKFSLVNHSTKTILFCSDGYRLARLTYSNRIRDRRFYDPLLYLYLMDINKHDHDQQIYLEKNRSFDDLPKLIEHFETDSLGFDGGNNLNLSTKYGSLTSLPTDDLPQITIEEILTAYTLLFTSSDRVQHEICSCLERTTRSLLISSERNDILTPNQLVSCLTNLVLSSTYGSLTFLHYSCLNKFYFLFIQIFKQQTTIVNDSELLDLCILYIVEHWLQAVLFLPTKLNTFELCRRQKTVSHDQENSSLCKAVKQLQLLQGSNVNLDEFLPSTLPIQRENLQGNDFQYNRITLIRLWFTLWSSIEKKLRRDTKNLPKYLNTIRFYVQSVLHSYPSLNSIRLLPFGHQIDLNDLFPPTNIHINNHVLSTKSYSTLNERRKQRRRSRNSIDQTTLAMSSPSRRRKPPTEARKALVLHQIVYSLFEQYNIRDAICILNIALKRETTSISSCLPLDLFSSNLFQHIDTRTHFGMPGHALRSVLRTLARFMARTMLINEKLLSNDNDEQIFIYSIDSACPLPNLFQSKLQTKARIIYLDRHRLNLAIEQQKLTQFWQPLKVLELFILGQSPNEAVLFAKLIGDWRTALCLASVLPPHNGSYDTSRKNSRTSPVYSPLNIITVDALLYTKLCEYLQIANLKSILKRQYKQDDILVFLQNLPKTLEQFLLCSTLLQVPLTEMLLRRLNAIMIYLFTLIPVFHSPKYYLPCPPIYTSILNTYDSESDDLTCKYETHIRLIYYRTIHIFIEILSTSRIQLSCLKWYLDYLTMTTNRRQQQQSQTNDSFQSLKILLKSLRFHKLPNIPDRILIYFRDFCIIIFLLDTRDRLSLALRNYFREKIEMKNLQSDRLSWQIISYATILLSFRCLISDEINLLRVVLNLFFDLEPSEQLMRALATFILARQHGDNDTEINAEVKFLVDKLKSQWNQINPTYVHLYEDFLKTILVQDVQGDIIEHYMNETIEKSSHQEPLLDFKPKWFETCVEYGEFMTLLIPLLLDTSAVTNLKQQELNNDHTKFDSKSIPLLQTMSQQFRELELPMNLDKRYLFKQIPTYVPPHEYVVFPVRMVQYDNQQTMFQPTSTNVNHTAVGNFVNIRTTQQPPGVVTLEQSHRRNVHSNATENEKNPSIEWDGRSDDPARSYVRQFDEPYADAARQSIWMTAWANRGFVSTNDQNLTSSMRIPVSAQFLAASSLISDQQRYDTIVKQYQQQMKLAQDQLDNDTDLTNVTKDSDDDDGNGTQSDIPSSPRRREHSFRKNSLEESMSLPIMSNDAGGEYGRSLDFRAPSRETGGDETPTYDPRDFPVDYYKGSPSPQHTFRQQPSPSRQMSPPTSNGFQQQTPSVRQSFSDRKFLDDSDPYLPLRLEQEEREKYALSGKNKTKTSNGHHSPARDTHDRRSPTRDPYSHRSPTRDNRHSRRSPTRDHHHRHRSPQRQQQPYFPQMQGPPTTYDLYRAAAPVQYVPTLRLPLLRLGAPVFNPTTSPMIQPRFLPPPASLHPPLPMLQMATQLPPPASLSPQATRVDQQKLAYVQNMMHHYAENNRPRLQLLQLRAPPRTTTNNELQIPMPASNIVTKSSDAKVDTGIQAVVPRQDGFILEPGLFQTLLHEATGVNFTSAEAHYSAARQIQQQALEARRRERSTMTDLPAHQILYDLQYARGGEGDERKYVNVTEIGGAHADALLAQIERDQLEREQVRLRQQQVSQPPTSARSIGFERQNAETLQEQTYQPQTMPEHPSTHYDANELQRKSELILERRRQREEEERQAEQMAFGNMDSSRSQRKVSYEPIVQTYELPDKDIPYEYLIKSRRSTEPLSDRSSHIVDPISVRSITPRSPRSPRKPLSSDRSVSIKTTIPREPFSPRKPSGHTCLPTTTTPRKTTSPTIADRHREARQRKQVTLIREREREALNLANEALYGEPIPPSRALDEFQLEALETSFTSTVRELAAGDGAINRTYDLDLLDDNNDSIGIGYTDYLSSRPMSAATTSNYNQNATQLSSRSAPSRRPSSATSSTRSSRQMTPMGKAIVQVKQKGPPPARSNMARKRPLSSPGNLGQKRGSMTAPTKTTQPQTKLVRTIRKASPPAHKPTTYNQRVRSLSKTDSEVSSVKKSDPTDPKSLMRLYGTRRVPGLYVPYERTEPRVTKTYAERMQELQRPATEQPRRTRQTIQDNENEFEIRPSSAPSSSISLSDWEVDDRVKQLLSEDPDATLNNKITRTVTPLENLDELDDDLDATTYSLTRVTEQTNENTYGDDLRLLQYRRTNSLSTNRYGGTRVSARSSAGGDMTARDESELSRGESSLASYLDWSEIDRQFPTGTQ